MRVQMLGLLPAILKPCGPTCAQPFMNRSVEAMTSEEMAETPAFVRENGSRAHEIAERLFRDFGGVVQVEVVGLDSPRGFWLSVRHRVGRGFAVVVDGKEVVRGNPAYGAVKEAVERAVRSRRVKPAQ